LLERYTLVGLAFSLTIILLDFYLLRKRKIQGRGFVFWFIVGAVVGLFSTVPYLFALLTLFYGTQELVTAITVTGFLFFLLMFFYLHYRLSELQTQLMKLAMEISAAKYSRKQSVTNPKSENTKEQEDKDE